MSSSASPAPPGALREALGACRRHWAYACGFSAAINLLYLAPTIYMLQVYDRVVPSRGGITLAFLTLLLLASLATLALLELVRSRLMVRASTRLEAHLAAPILKAAQDAAGAGGSGQAMRNFDALRQTLTGAGMLAIFDLPWTPVYVLLCFFLHPLLGGLALLGTVVLAALTLCNEHVIRPRLQAANLAAAQSYSAQAQSLAQSDVIRALGMGDAMVQWHREGRATANLLQQEASFAAGHFMTASKFMRLALQSLSLGLAAYLVIEQKISAGAIFAASLLIARALSPVDQVLGSWRSLAEAHSAYGELKALLGAAHRPVPRTVLPAPSGALRVEQLAVGRGPGLPPRLSNIGFELAPGEVLGLVGPSGAGKTTLLRALVGALPADQGLVRLDGADIAAWDPERLGRHIGYLPQDLALFPGTIKQNICRFQDRLSASEDIDTMAVAAAVAAGAHEMILNLPLGYDSLIDWGGRGVSLGQAQRIALARAFFGDPKLVVLDEPNAHLDVEGEAALLVAVTALKAKGAVVVVSAHRTGLIEAMDKVLVLVDGRMVQLGPKDAVFRVAEPRTGPSLIAQSPPAREVA